MTSEYTHYALHNVKNYNKTIQNTPHDIQSQFLEIIVAYIHLITEKLKIKNKQHFIFIFERGLQLIMHVFSMIFYYTKNLKLTLYHSQKAYYFYIEFIEQITDENITFLQLSSRDALMFVYKKTIFDLNNEYKKNMVTNNDDLSIICYNDENNLILKTILSFLIHHADFKYINNKASHEYINICCDKIHIFGNKINKKNITCVFRFANFLNETPHKYTINSYFNILDNFVKQLHKKQLDDQIIIKNINNLNINEIKDNNIIFYIFTI